MFGATGMGKTQALRSLLKSEDRAFCLDCAQDLDESDVDCVATSREEVLEYLEGLDADGRESFSVAYQPPVDDPEPEAAAFLARLAWAAQDCILVIDEAHVACNYNDCSPEVLLVVRRGRHRRVSLMIVSQRPAEVHPTIRSECFSCETFLFRLSRRPDLAEITNERDSDLAAQVRQLPKLECMRVTPEEDPQRWRVSFTERGRPMLSKVAG